MRLYSAFCTSKQNAHMDAQPPEMFHKILFYCEEYYPSIASVSKSWRARALSYPRALRAISYKTLIQRGHFTLATWARPTVCKNILQLIIEREYAFSLQYTCAANTLEPTDVARIIHAAFRSNTELAYLLLRKYHVNDILIAAVHINDIDFIIFLRSEGGSDFLAASKVAQRAGNKIMALVCTRCAIDKLFGNIARFHI